MKKVIFYILMTCLSMELFAQETPVTWYFGYKGGIRFLTDGTTIPYAGNEDNTWYEGNTVVNDEFGNVVFQASPKYLRRSTLIIKQLLGGNSATQGSLAVQIPGETPGSNVYKFLLFSLKAVEDGGAPNFSVCFIRVSSSGSPPVYSVVAHDPEYIYEDIRMSEKLTSTTDMNGTWVVAHDFNPDFEANTFYKYHITEELFGDVNSTIEAVNRLHDVEMPQSVGAHHTGQGENAQGQMKFSSDGTKLGLVIPEARIFEIYTFNKSNGMLSDESIHSHTVSPSNGYLYGCEFSPTGRIFYTSEGQADGPWGERCIYQWDISQPTIGDPYILATYFAGDYVYMALQLGPNNKIYSTKGSHNPKLSVINNPNIFGEGCDYDENTVPISGEANWGLPSYLTIGQISNPVIGCQCTSSTTADELIVTDRATGTATIDLRLNSGSIVAKTVIINIANFEVSPLSEECKRFCEMNTPNIGMFATDIPFLLNVEGSFTPYLLNQVSFSSHEITWDLSSDPQVITNEVIRLNLRFPFISALGCCPAEYYATFRVSYIDAGCQICQDVVYAQGLSENSEDGEGKSCSTNPSDKTASTGKKNNEPDPEAVEPFFKAFPNPNDGTFTIYTSVIQANLTYEVYDSRGVSIASGKLEGKTQKVTISPFIPGMYFVKVSNGNNEYLQKIILQH
ncbi:MAG: T9SS type A sorting domain-containing protein [Bacteroidales bacterium]|nr:T9SS type A sorting domain-containing protein [Bacteroidales bacterium]